MFIPVFNLLFVIFQLVDSQPGIPGPDDPQCIPIDNDLCRMVGWSEGTVPNFLEQQNVRIIREESSQYLPLYDTGCSNAFLHFLCSIYYPPCFRSNVTGSEQLVIWPPCQELCDYVYCSCLSAVLELGGEWSESLRCTRFPSHRMGETCFPGNIDLEFFEGLSLPNITGRTPPSRVMRCTDFSINSTTSTMTPSTGPTLSQSISLCPIPNLAAPNGSADQYSLGQQVGCSISCDPAELFGVDNAGNILSIVVLVFSGLGLGLCLAMLSTFLIDRSRFSYPERPIVYVTISLAMVNAVLAISSLANIVQYSFACEDQYQVVFQRLPSLNSSFKGVACTIAAIFLYYATMASLVWWVVLMVTWLLSTTLKWAAEPITRFWFVFQVVGWGIPLIQTIFILGIQWIDGDVGTGVCFVGNLDTVSKGILVFSPTALYLLIGLTLFFVACVSLVNIHSLMKKQQDTEKVDKLQKLLVHVVLFVVLYCLPIFVLCVLYVYELIMEETWESYVLCRYSTVLCPSPSATPSSTAAAVVKYIVWIAPSSSLLVWLLSHKTLMSWGRLISDITPCRRQQTRSRNGKKNPS